MNHRDQQRRGALGSQGAGTAAAMPDPGRVSGRRRRRRRPGDGDAVPSATDAGAAASSETLPPDLAAVVDGSLAGGRRDRQQQAGDPSKNRSLPGEGQVAGEGEGVTENDAGQVAIRGGGGQAPPVNGETGPQGAQPAAATETAQAQPAPADQEQAAGGGEGQSEQAAGNEREGPAPAAAEPDAAPAGLAQVDGPALRDPGSPDEIPVISVDVVHEREVGGWRAQRDEWMRRHPNAPPGTNPYAWENLSDEQKEAERARDNEHKRIETQVSGLRERVSALHEQATSKRDALMAHAESLKAAVDSEVAIYESIIAGAASQGEVAVVTEAAAADAEIEAGALEAAGNLAAAEADALASMAGDEAMMSAATAGSFAQAESQISGLETAETVAFTQLLLTLAADIDRVTADCKAQAEAAGTQAKQTYDPTRFDGSPMGAYDAGLESLRADVKRKIATDTAKEAGDAAERTTKPVADQLRTEAEQLAQNAVVPYTQAVQGDIAPTSERATTQLESAAQSARTRAEAGGEAARQSIDASRQSAQDEVAGHRERSRVRFSGKARELVDHIRALGAELASNIEVNAVALANGYAATVTAVRDDVEAAETPEEAAALLPGVEDAITSLDEQHAADIAALDEAYDTGIEGIDAFVAGQEGELSQAVAQDIAAIRQARQRTRVQTADAGRQLAQRLSGLAESFRGEAQRGVDESQAQTAAFVGQTQQGAAARRAELVATVTQVKDQAREQLAAMLARIPQAVEQKTADEYAQKEQKLEGKAAKIFDAIDGVGTDEGDIHKVLAEASYGEIEAIEATYNRMYSERAEDGMTPLRYDLADEMGGDELGAAMAFLRHDRQAGIRLALDSATGFFNDEEENIRALLATCSDEEIEYLNTSPEGQAVIADVRGSLSGCDLDVVDTYLDTSLSREDRQTRVTAIELYENSIGQMGTDEDQVEQILENAKTPEERRRLREAFNQYSDEKLAEQAAALEAQGYTQAAADLESRQGEDHLSTMLESEFSGHEQTVMETLAAEERNETAVDAARLLEGAEGAGTDEKRMLDALQDDSAEATRLQQRLNDPDTPEEEKARIRQQLEAMAQTRREELNAQLAELSDGEETSVEILLYQEFFDCSPELARLRAPDAATYDDVLAGNRPPILSDPVLGYMVALRKLKQGFAEPELELMYACSGGGTNEALIKSALSNGGNPKSKSEVAQLRTKFKQVWGEDLADRNEMTASAHRVWENPEQYQDYDDFTAPSGILDGELDGRDWLDVRVLLCGEPTTPEEKNYLTLLKTTFEMDGAGDAFIGALDEMGFTDKASHLAAVRERYRQSANTMRELDLGEERLSDLEQGRLSDEGRDAELSDEERERIRAASDEFAFQGAALEQAAESYGQFKASVISGIITALEIAAGVLVSVLTAGATSGLLVIILANAAVGVAGIALKRAALGAQYGIDQMAIDAAIAIGSAAVSEIKVFSKFGKAGADAAAGRALADAAVETGTELAQDGVVATARSLDDVARRAVAGNLGETATRAARQADAAVARVTASEAGQEATEATLRESAQAATGRGAREAAEQATETTAREAAERAGARSGREAASEAGETATREAASEAGETATRETAQQAAGAAGRAAAREGAEQATQAAAKKTIQEVALEELDKAVWSTLWQRVTSEQTWEGKPFEVLGEIVRTMALEVLKGVVADRLGGAIPGLNRQRGSHVANAAQAGARGGLGHLSGTLIDQAMAEMMDPSTDSGRQFWESFLQGLPKAVASAAADKLKETLGEQAASNRAVRVAGRDYIAGRKTAEDLERMHQAGELSDEQVRQLVRYIERNQYDLGHLAENDTDNLHTTDSLPDSFRTLATPDEAAGTTSATSTADPAATTAGTDNASAADAEAAATTREEAATTREATPDEAAATREAATTREPTPDEAATTPEPAASATTGDPERKRRPAGESDETPGGRRSADARVEAPGDRGNESSFIDAAAALARLLTRREQPAAPSAEPDREALASAVEDHDGAALAAGSWTSYDKHAYLDHVHTAARPLAVDEWIPGYNADEAAFIEGLAAELNADPTRRAAAMRALPSLESCSVDDIRSAWHAWKKDAEFAATSEGESAYSRAGFSDFLLSGKSVPRGPLVTLAAKPRTAYGDYEGVGPPGGTIYLSPLAEVETLTVAEFPRQLGIIANNSAWDVAQHKLSELLDSASDPETGRQQWAAWVEGEGRAITGGFKAMTHMHVFVDGEELLSQIRYHSPHKQSGITEVTIPRQEYESLDLRWIDIPLTDSGQTIGEAIREAIAGEIPELADEVAQMDADALSRVIKREPVKPE